MPQRRNYQGQRFGKLVVLEKAPSRSGHTYWLCQCDCGNKKEIQTAHLTSGATVSCGCSMGLNNRKDLQERQCILCGTIFKPNNYTRLYCFQCSPQGLTQAETLRHKKRALKHLLVKYKGSKCQRCGYDKCEGALQFHHRDPKEKDFALSQINLNDTDFSINKIKQEIDKCDLLCANCHFEEHYLD